MNQDFLETVVNKLGLPIAIFGAAGMTVLLVAALLGMIMTAPGAAGTADGPAMFHHQAQR